MLDVICKETNKMSKNKALLICLEALVLVAVVGCSSTIVSTDAGVYERFKLKATSSKDVDSVYAATLHALDKLQLEVTNKAKDIFSAKIIAKSADGQLITVKISPTEDKTTSYSIQVGTFGNEERSRMIYKEIVNSLGIVKTK